MQLANLCNLFDQMLLAIKMGKNRSKKKHVHEELVRVTASGGLSLLKLFLNQTGILPPAAPQNNVRLITPELHGFENAPPPFPSKQAVVIFDGNTKKPSDYSR